MQTVVVAFLISLVVALAMTPLVRGAAFRFGVLDHALTSRKIHGKPIPRLGGVAIVVAFFVPLVALFFFDTGVGRLLWSQPQRALALILGGLAIAALGIFDDLKGSGARIKFAVQVLVAAAMWFADYRADTIATPFGTFGLGVLGFPLTVLWIVGVTNALNLIDGLDGLATGVALAATGTIFWVSLTNHRMLMALVMAGLAGALLGFLRYNFHPASIFMGDSGSLFVGFILATTALETHEKTTTAVALLVPLVALGLPIGDTLLAMTRRTVRGQPMFSSDRGPHPPPAHGPRALPPGHGARALRHLHRDGGRGGGALPLRRRADPGLRRGHRRHRRHAARRRRGTSASTRGGSSSPTARTTWPCGRRSGGRASSCARRRTRTPSGGWCRGWCRTLQASCAALTLVARNGTVRTSEFSWGFDEAPDGLLRARFSLLGERPDDGRLELGFTDGRRTVDRDTEIAIELLCEHVLRGGAADGREARAGDERVEEAPAVPEVGQANAVRGFCMWGRRARLPPCPGYPPELPFPTPGGTRHRGRDPRRRDAGPHAGGTVAGERPDDPHRRGAPPWIRRRQDSRPCSPVWRRAGLSSSSSGPWPPWRRVRR